MGYIPLFLTASAACILFFLTVRNALLAKITLQKKISSQLVAAHPELEFMEEGILDPEKIQKIWKEMAQQKSIPQDSIELLRELKVNQFQFNKLIKKAPYNWVAAFGGFKTI